MQNPLFYEAFLAISWIKLRSVVTNYSECMRSNSAYRDAYVTRSQTQSHVCLWLDCFRVNFDLNETALSIKQICIVQQ